jgi:hypothetical protein
VCFWWSWALLWGDERGESERRGYRGAQKLAAKCVCTAMQVYLCAVASLGWNVHILVCVYMSMSRFGLPQTQTCGMSRSLAVRITMRHRRLNSQG